MPKKTAAYYIAKQKLEAKRREGSRKAELKREAKHDPPFQRNSSIRTITASGHQIPRSASSKRRAKRKKTDNTNAP